ncbi:peptidase inhibitor family I36 protein [Streptomyces sp. CA-250714]|uniref:peptidase inhibitor family I36 protein n=1 Tax=Streptomyces sp. CA-250714 TaxID=3240060 RepID=UPI003D94FF4D
MKRTIALTLGALSLSAASLVAVTPGAQADARIDVPQCKFSAAFCLYEHDRFDGDYMQNPQDEGCDNVGRIMNNKGSSMINASNDRIRLYDKANCAGSSGYAAKPKSEDKDFTNNGFDNKATSARY